MALMDTLQAESAGHIPTPRFPKRDGAADLSTQILVTGLQLTIDAEQAALSALGAITTILQQSPTNNTQPIFAAAKSNLLSFMVASNELRTSNMQICNDIEIGRQLAKLETAQILQMAKANGLSWNNTEDESSINYISDGIQDGIALNNYILTLVR
jgi:hypothetical protein